MTIATAVYAASLIPLVTILGMYFFKIIPLWILKLYALGFLITGFGWEIWYTYGWIDGDPVWERRPDALNAAIPYQINWILNSLYDAFVCVSGVFWVWLAGGRTLRLFKGINLLCLLILFTVFVGQNIYVELGIYQGQIQESHEMSWAPLSPKFLDTITFFGHRMKFNTQITWVLMVPIMYYIIKRIMPKESEPIPDF